MDALMLPLPKDWEIKTFRDISTINQGLQIPISQRLKAPTEHAKFYITIQALNNRKEFEYIKTYNESVVCHKDDILMTRTGNTGMVITNIEGVFHNNFFKINFDRTLINKDFLVYFLSLEQTQKTILKKAGTSTIPDLNHNDFYSLLIPLPPLHEQIAIADILSALDNYLHALRALILKKESVKKALSFELLSQRKRLKGFNQAWQRVRLGDICEITTGSLDANEMVHYGKYRFYTCAKEYYFIDKYAFDTEAILISGNGAYVGYVHYYKGKFNAYQRTYVLDNFSEHIIFIKYFLTMFLQSHIQTNRNEGNTPYIVMATLKDFEIPLPPLNEQSAIADILSALDKEIASLKNKKRQFDNIKKALNHDLMSAKIRVLKK
ncbi:restriction endonuclease subunit S [Helicobacter pylori]|uniref:restriction endonuclease subunit S n=1 Tax=Helicobacter pylori TaxID=210 RepID=UPI00112BB561|nr:restriction endonuclease subunit S [Helicobacter pylori]TPH46732.1 restriction endonuclease subunit S [Helicobacter pylori]TPH47176.1 restriction endonuclease subunit S [Helicobacter pylori]